MSVIFISICIPAYKRVGPLRSLLESVSLQTFRDFEVIVTDDSASADIERICLEFAQAMPVRYIRHEKAFGTPGNWNEAIRHANGDWVKIMHDDDWFDSKDSLAEFAKAIASNPGSSFIYCAYNNCFEGTDRKERVSYLAWWHLAIRRNPAVLLGGNRIGPPSCVIYKKTADLFDERFRWLVDIEFYIRYLRVAKAVYINRPLVNIGISATQVTRSSFRNPEVEVPEHFLLLEEIGERSLKNVLVYDAWWRLFRNLSLKSESQVREAGYQGPIPARISGMLRFQDSLPNWTLKNGVFSKILMIFRFVFA
jgi:glycosyltransferase involved in cell wall biosynthesis